MAMFLALAGVVGRAISHSRNLTALLKMPSASLLRSSRVIFFRAMLGDDELPFEDVYSLASEAGPLLVASLVVGVDLLEVGLAEGLELEFSKISNRTLRRYYLEMFRTRGKNYVCRSFSQIWIRRQNLPWPSKIPSCHYIDSYKVIGSFHVRLIVSRPHVKNPSQFLA